MSGEPIEYLAGFEFDLHLVLPGHHGLDLGRLHPCCRDSHVL
jgi:hypothetical protein